MTPRISLCSQMAFFERFLFCSMRQLPRHVQGCAASLLQGWRRPDAYRPSLQRAGHS
jgi:hypothetical protein